MSQRPKFWIHRSRSFWGGFAIFLTLFGAWILTMFSYAEVSYLRNNGTALKSASLRLVNGGLDGVWSIHTYGTTSRGRSAPHSDWVFELTQSNGAILKPEFRWGSRQGWGHSSIETYHLFVPLWLPLLAWTLFWLYRMHRQDKREEALFGQAAEVPAEE